MFPANDFTVCPRCEDILHTAVLLAQEISRKQLSNGICSDERLCMENWVLYARFMISQSNDGTTFKVLQQRRNIVPVDVYLLSLSKNVGVGTSSILLYLLTR